MPTLKWTIDFTDYKKYRDAWWDRPSLEAIKEFYGGFKFNKIRREPMFQEELSDLEKVYESTLAGLHKQVEDILPPLLMYMESFVELHHQNEAIREKLDVLRAKLGKKTDEENENE